ncbi:unnamed protein product [Cylicocyclus nassatus]|uniref:Carboxypeptidase Q n=1 Tax=Cylicocyclus nassatus TaxID=53992 RepID=A0AA36HB59_CYLNA|nr:unnamed protein product [Cylicocyclus nassatus]
MLQLYERKFFWDSPWPTAVTDENGLFQVLGTDTEMTQIDPQLRIWTMCSRRRGSPYSSKKLTNSSALLLKEILRKKSDSLSWLEQLCDDFGPRHVGSASLENAIDWVLASLRSDNFSAHSEPVPGLPHWVRGDDSAYIVEPRLHKLNILAIDGSPPGQMEKEVVVIESLFELKAKNIAGKIVVTDQKWSGYGRTMKFRKIAAEAAKLGAAAVLVKSVTPFSLYTPHTGAGARGSPIPAACITAEESAMISRWTRRGKRVIIRLNITSAESPEPVLSRNVVFEILGTTLPHEVVLLSAHMDSWDIGQGALDDGGGMAAVRAAMLAIQRLGRINPAFRPKRTIRGVFWTAEEQGTLGAIYYHDDHPTGKERFVFASETDQGAFRPRNYNSLLRYQGDERRKSLLQEIVNHLNANGIPLRIEDSRDQVDLEVFANAGVPCVNYESDRGKDYYFNFHHSEADYVSIFEEDDINYTAGIFAVLAHNIANLENW